MGKTYLDRRGYPRYSDTGELVHIKVVEKRIGRRLRRNEVVHHKDENKTNFKSTNLVVMKRREHLKLHKERFRRRDLIFNTFFNEFWLPFVTALEELTKRRKE
ncbi:HNH endonuclease [Chloroflexota bacterium]